MLRLHHATASTASSIVRLTLAEKGLSYESRLLDLQKGEQHHPDYRALNPKGVVPTLEHDGQVICESTVIAQYLDEVFPSPALAPASPHGRANMRLWLRRVDDTIHEAWMVLTFALAFRRFLAQIPPEALAARFARATPGVRERLTAAVQHGIDAPTAADALAAHDELCAVMDAALARSPYLVGDAYSLADAAITPYFVRAEMLGLAALWTGRRAHVTGWFERVRARASFDRAFTQVFTDADRQRMTVPPDASAARLQAVLAR